MDIIINNYLKTVFLEVIFSFTKGNVNLFDSSFNELEELSSLTYDEHFS